MLTIGAFAKACRLTPKALRLYDDLDLLRPAHVDPGTGYRYYSPDQLEQARLVAWLRRIGMPLDRVREVCALGREAAAAEIRAYWTRVEAETAHRRDLAALLIDHLTTTAVPVLRCSAASDRGRIRPANQDTAHASGHLLAVADGYGPEGARASGAAVEALRSGLEARADVLTVLAEATDAVRRWEDAGTTLTALVRMGTSGLALVHIGDCRAYLLRSGGLFRLTEDHAVAGHRPALLLKSLGTAPPDLCHHTPLPGDRYLLCSDGLTAVLPDSRIRETLSTATAPDDAIHALIATANDEGGPDNISCAVADVGAAA